MWLLSRAERAWAPLLVLAVLLAYANALAAGFQFDDWNVIVGDPRVQSVAAWWASMPGIRPVLKLSYAMNHAAGLGAPGFHAVNVAVHLANVLLVFALLRRRAGGGVVAAAVAALLFALHPAQTEAVTYASGRSVSLSALFALGSLYAWVTGRESGRAWLSAGLSPLLFAVALGVRETAAVLPLAMMLWQATIPSAGSTAGGWRAIAMHWVVLALATVAALAMPAYQQFFATSLGARPLASQVLTQVNALAYLAGQLVRPDRLNADPMLPVVTVMTPLLAAKVAGLAGVAGIALAGLRQRPQLAFGLLWFFLWLLPTNSLLPRFDVANDRQLYVALIGPAWLCGLALAALWRRSRAPAVALVAALSIGLAFATVLRNGVYADETRFWTDVTARTPANARAWSNLGYAHALAGRRAEAEQAYLRALQADPANAKAAVNLALLRRAAPVTPATDTEAGIPRASSP